MDLKDNVVNEKISHKEYNYFDKRVKISFIIINYNLAEEIENCLNSILDKINTKRKITYEIIIVDNNSPDKALPNIEKKFSKDNIKFYYLEENIGFGKGCNFGFSKAHGEYICFLNPDTIIKEDIFPSIINLFEGDKSIGIVGPKQQTKFPFFDFSAGFYPNIFFELFNLIGMGVFFEGFIVSLYTRLKKNKNIKVGWILGAAIFIRAELFKEVNGFDKDYFMFFEEVDLCRRVTKKGYNVIYSPSLAIHHIGSVSGKKDYRVYTIRTYSSKYIYISKHYKFLHKFILKFLLFAELFSQIIIWTVLYPMNKDKAKRKLNAFFYLINHKMHYEHWN
jgi:GT2 family glycosyltransferase